MFICIWGGDCYVGCICFKHFYQEIYKDGKFYNQNGDEFYIVHQYDRIEQIKREIDLIKEKKFEVVKSQNYERAANLRDEERKLIKKLEQEEAYIHLQQY